MHVIAVNVSLTAGDSAVDCDLDELVDREGEVLPECPMRTHDMSLLESSGHLLGGGRWPDADERKAAGDEVPRPVQELDDGVALDGDLDERGVPHELQVARPGRDDRRTVRLERAW